MKIEVNKIISAVLLLVLTSCGKLNNNIEQDNRLTYFVTYDGNNNTDGTVPVDTTVYKQNETVTVLGNTGNLGKKHYIFTGWNTQPDGAGNTYIQGDTFSIGSSNIILYANYRQNALVFTTTGSQFAPVITVTGSYEILWTWSDYSTDNSTTPVKNYGSDALRDNYLTVTPWSALQRINIGYDGGDGGSSAIEYVANQNVTSVQGLELVAPYLQQWCSSYNNIQSLDFENFIQLNTIECYYSSNLENVNLFNTPALSRACFEDCDLQSLDVSQSPNLQDLRGAANAFTTVQFAEDCSDIWHICIRDNNLTDTQLFADMTRFPNIRDLYIWNCNQEGALIVQSTAPDEYVGILADGNKYTSADFRGALQNETKRGVISLNNNLISSININECDQITTLFLRYNNLATEQVDYILHTLDDMGRSPDPAGEIDLRNNAQPSSTGLTSITNLQGRNWTVLYDSE